MSIDQSVPDAKIFGWKEIPFEPLGVSTGKYPILRPSDFDEIIQKAEDSKNDKKVACCIVKAPQGAGKTAISTEVTNYYRDKTDTFVIFNSLINIEPSDLTKQVMTSLSTEIIDSRFIEELGYDNSKKYDSSELVNFIVGAFEKVIEKNRAGIWIIDEFDTISTSEDESNDEKTDFLQFLRSIIDRLASSSKFDEKGFLIIMAHTEKSIEDFIKVLQSLHSPATERFLGTGTIEIGYKLDEVKEIIKQRLEWAQDSYKGGFEPFDEKAIETLFDAINEHMGSNELTSFRTLEKSCYSAVKDAVKENKRIIDEDLLLSAFDKLKDPLH